MTRPAKLRAMKRFGKRWRAAWLLFPALLAVPLWLAKGKRENSIDVILTRYPQSEDFNTIVQAHLKLSHLTVGQTTLLSTWFLDGRTNVQMGCVISGSGQVSSARYVSNWAIQNFRDAVLPRSQLDNVKTRLKRLPPSSPPLLRGNLLLMTFRTSNGYETRIYDRTNLPPQVREIYKLTGAPLEAATPSGNS